MADDDHQAALVVEDPLVVDLLRVGTLPRDALAFSHQGLTDAGNLRLLLQVIDTVKERMIERQFDRLAVGEDFFDLVVEVGPFGLAPEVVNHQEAAVEQIPPESLDLVVHEFEVARFDQVDERISEQFGIGQFENAPVRIDLERRELLQTVRKVEIAVGKVGRPPTPASGRVVLDAHERKDILLERRIDLPRRHAIAVGRHDAGIPPLRMTNLHQADDGQQSHDQQ